MHYCFQVNLSELEPVKAEISSLNLSLHTLKADLEARSVLQADLGARSILEADLEVRRMVDDDILGARVFDDADSETGNYDPKQTKKTDQNILEAFKLQENISGKPYDQM